jgi:hypothetical protein
MSNLADAGRRHRDQQGPHRNEEDSRMKFALLLNGSEAAWDALAEDAQQAAMGDYYTVTEAMKEAGEYLGGEALTPSATARTLRIRDGKRMVTDGPFIESKEILGGFYLVECKSVEEALDWAAQLPDAKIGSIEVRELLDVDALMAEGDAAAEGG